MISRPLYVPHSLHTRCGTCFAPQCGHVAREGGATFHWALRRLVRERDIFFLGTAIGSLVSSVLGAEEVFEDGERRPRVVAGRVGIQVRFETCHNSLTGFITHGEHGKRQKSLIDEQLFDVDRVGSNAVPFVLRIWHPFWLWRRFFSSKTSRHR